jgi:hypothetical protein
MSSIKDQFIEGPPVNLDIHEPCIVEIQPRYSFKVRFLFSLLAVGLLCVLSIAIISKIFIPIN